VSNPPSLVADGGFACADLRRSLDLLTEYADNAIGLVDASIVAVAERLGITRILTLDRRHFQSIRPRHCSTFEIIP
jgi:predicted nucleic acid-binding protein